jgi:signal transduction histidine kinase
MIFGKNVILLVKESSLSLHDAHSKNEINKALKIEEISKLALTILDEQVFLDSVCKNIGLFLNANICGIIKYDVLRNNFKFVAKFEIGDETTFSFIKNEPNTIAGLTFLHDNPIIFDEIKNIPEIANSPIMKFYDAKSGSSCTIKNSMGKWGVFGLLSITEGHITKSEGNFIKQISELIGLFLENKRRINDFINLRTYQASNQLVAGITHDFNNFLSIIRGYVETIRLENIENSKSLQKDDLLKTIENINLAIDKSKNLIRQLQIIVGKEELKYAKININSIILSLKDFFVQKLQTTNFSNLKISYDLDEFEELIVMGDTTQFSQILMNLVTNAIESLSTDGKIEIRTNSERSIKPNYKFENEKFQYNSANFVHISIIDNGIGIKQELIEKLFIPYSTGEKTSTTTEKNYGLGLSIVYSIVQQMKGDIYVNSQINHGTKFDIFFPRIIN